MNKIFTNPTNGTDMVYDAGKHRYILTEEYVRSNGIDLALVLETGMHPEPSNLPAQILDRVSLLVYTNIYNYGRNRGNKEYLMACDADLRPIIRDAMFERLNYITSSGDLSLKSGALISQGVRIETKDLIPSVVELMLLLPTGLLHRGDYFIVKNDSLVY